MKNIFSFVTGLICLFGSNSVALAGSLTPAAYQQTIRLNQTVSVDKTVIINSTDVPDVVNTMSTAVDNKYDILFLADNTGSMGAAIGNVQTNAQSLLQQLSTSYNDIQFGVARYYGDPKENDFTYQGNKYLGKNFVQVKNPGSSANTITQEWTYKNKVNGKFSYDYKLSGMGLNHTQTVSYGVNYGSQITYYYQENGPNKAYQLQEGVNGGSVNDAIAAINNWEAFGGGDLPEANIFALHQAATSGGATDGGLSTGFNTQWRSDAKKIIVWFGDAASHELSVDKTEAIRELTSKGITVVAINASNTTTSLTSGINTDSQASSIATATNGTYAAVYSSNLTDSMMTLIGDAVSNMPTQTTTPGTIDLVFESQGNTSGITVTYTCTDQRGCTNVSGNQSRTFKMDVTGNAVGQYNFNTVVKDVPGATGTNNIQVFSISD
jgi:hypothetical protein